MRLEELTSDTIVMNRELPADQTQSVRLLRRALEASQTELEIMRAACDLIGGADQDELLQKILAQAVRTARADLLAFFLLEDRDRLRMAAEVGVPAEDLPGLKLMARGGGLLWDAIDLRQPAHVTAVEPFGPPSAAPAIPGFDALMALPVLLHEEPAGVLLVGWRIGGADHDESAELAKTLAGQLARVLAVTRSRTETAQAAENIKRRFLWAIGHDMRTPLNVIQMAAALLRETLKNRLRPGELDMFFKLESGITRATVVLADLAELSDLQAGRVTLEPGRFELDPLLQRLAARFREPAARKGLTLSCRTTIPTSLTLETDRQKLDRLLSCLLDNAIKFTVEGGVVLSAVWKTPIHPPGDPTQPEGARLEITVSDTGPGVPPEQQAHIFDEFYQLDNPARCPWRGKGQGLPIARHLARLMAMQIRITNAEGPGAVFTLGIPARLVVEPGSAVDERDGTAQTPRPLVPRLDPGAKAKHARHGRRILVVDDDEETVNLLVTLLGTHGFVAAGAHSGQQALDAVGLCPPHLILMDMVMPGLDGLEVIRRLKREPASRSIHVLALTGDVTAECSRAATEVGCVGWVQKPVNPPNLLAQICEILRVGAAPPP